MERKIMDFKEIVMAALRRTGRDALANESLGCACDVDDLAPCGRTMQEVGQCSPALRKKCPCCGETLYVTDGDVCQKAAKPSRSEERGSDDGAPGQKCFTGPFALGM